MPLVAGLSLALAVLAGCGGDDSVDQTPNAEGSTAPTTGTGAVLPSQLVGQWDVEGEGVEKGAVITFSADEASLLSRCGVLDGSWKSLPGGVFLADLYSGPEDCIPDDDASFTPAWLGTASSFSVRGEQRQLHGNDGQVTAILRPAAGRPKLPSTETEEYVDPPVLTDEERAELDRLPPDFPPGIRPAEASELLGTWVLPGETGGKGNWPHATFGDDGWIVGSDGCNGTGARYALAEGALLQSDGVSTLIGCENIDITAGAVLVGFDGETLVLIGKDGQEIRRAVRGPAPKLGNGRTSG